MGFLKFLKEKIFNKNNGATKEKMDNYVTGLDKSRHNFVDRLKNLQARFNKVNEEYFEELEQILISSDIGVNTTLNIIEATKNEAKLNNVYEPEKINELIVDKMFIAYTASGIVDTRLNLSDDMSVILVVGVNGVGKTTSIAKLCNRLKNNGKKVMLVAGDTFRAGAVEQLKIWADRIGVGFTSGKENADPTSVIYDGVMRAKNEGYDVVICDSAGRVQTRQYLMDELAKMNRIITKVIGHEADEVLLIIDATTGQNGVIQAKSFFDACNVSGIVLTKMDSTSKGGIVLAIKDELNIPVKFVCFGEKLQDIEEFDLDNYLYGLTQGME